MLLTERFWSKVDKSGECWLWTAYVLPNGYGRFGLFGKTEYAHRVAFELDRGEIPSGTEIDHLCRVKRCVRPAHLQAVTHKVNIQRARPFMTKGYSIQQAMCRKGLHGLEGDNVYREPKRGRRACLACRRAYAVAYDARRRAERA